MAPPTLGELAIKTAVRYSKRKSLTVVEIREDAAKHRTEKVIYDTGDLRYELCKPIIDRVENAEQLHEIEQNSNADVIGNTSRSWKMLLRRDAGHWLDTHPEAAPESDADWYEFYCYAVGEQQKELEANAARFQASQASLDANRAQNSMTISKAPGNLRSALDIRGWGNRQRHKGPRTDGPGIGPRTKVTGGRSLLIRARNDSRSHNMMLKRGEKAVQARRVTAPAAIVHPPRRSDNLFVSPEPKEEPQDSFHRSRPSPTDSWSSLESLFVSPPPNKEPRNLSVSKRPQAKAPAPPGTIRPGTVRATLNEQRPLPPGGIMSQGPVRPPGNQVSTYSYKPPHMENGRITPLWPVSRADRFRLNEQINHEGRPFNPPRRDNNPGPPAPEAMISRRVPRHRGAAIFNKMRRGTY